MNAGRVLRIRWQTTHYLGDGHTIVARPGWERLTWLVEECSTDRGSYIHHSCSTRVEADLIAEMVAAAHGHSEEH